MTVVNPKSISGINSITMASGSDNLLTIHTTNTTERVRVNSDGDVIVGSGITVSPDGDIFATGVTTSTTFVGALTGNVTGNISGGTVAGSTGTFTGDVDIADKIIHTGDTNTAIRFPAADTITAETGGTERLRINSTGQTIVGDSVAQLSTSSERPFQVHSVNGPKIAIGRNDTSIVSGNTIGGLEFYGNDADGTFVNTASIIVNANGDHGDNDKPTRMQFYTTADGGSSAAEALRITSDGHLVIGGDSNNTFAGLQRLDIFNTSTADNYHGSLIRLITKNAAGNSTASYEMVKYKEGTVSHNNNESGGSINFYAGGATRLQVLSTGNINVNDGDLVIGTDGHGISFAADGNTGGMTSELLDDYEEGTFTPTSNATLTESGGSYTKIGRQVTVHIRVVVASQSSSSNFEIGSLPFTAAMQGGVSNGAMAGGFGYISGGGVIPQIHDDGDDNDLRFYNFATPMSISNVSSREFRFGFVYHTAT